MRDQVDAGVLSQLDQIDPREDADAGTAYTGTQQRADALQATHLRKNASAVGSGLLQAPQRRG